MHAAVLDPAKEQTSKRLDVDNLENYMKPTNGFVARQSDRTPNA
jgi:hypothetical protein